MDVKEAIEGRRSIRRYEKREISDDIIRKLIDSARLAPSGLNAQPSRYLVVKDQKTKSLLRENEVFPQDFVCKAPVIIVCCTDPGAYRKNVEGLDNTDEVRAIRDLSIASSFLVLRAAELGLGTCYVGWVDERKIKEVLGILGKYLVPYVITAGYPAEQPKATPRKGIDGILLRTTG